MAEENTKVTWLLPVKNGMPYLPETLASIQSQTYRNWEVLAWDNGSTDGTLEILKEWIPSCLPGRVISDQPLNLGESLAEMVKMCDTELCARIDADDVNLPDRLEKEVLFLQSHLDVAVVGTQMNRLDEFGVNHGPFYPMPLEHNDILNFMLHANAIAHPSVLFRRSAILEAGNYRNVGPVNVEDYDLWMRVAKKCKLANLDKPLLNYRIHEKSSTQIAMTEQKLEHAMNDRFCKQGPALYGCTEEEARQLRERRHPQANRTLRRIAEHLSETQAGYPRDDYRSESFLIATQKLAQPDNPSVPKKALRFGKRIFMRFLLHKPVAAALDYRRSAQEARRRKKWLESLAARDVALHPSVEFTGNALPYDNLTIGSRSMIERDTTFWFSSDVGADPKLTMADRVYIGRNCYLGVYQPISIGESAQIGAYSYVISANHKYADRDVFIRDQGFVGAPIVIEDDVWIGAHVVVLPGVTIGKGAIVAAGSVVNKDIASYEVWGGVPAKFLKQRP